MKTLLITALMVVFSFQVAHANEATKTSDKTSSNTRIIREIR
jgi:hypothetical protein